VKVEELQERIRHLAAKGISGKIESCQGTDDDCICPYTVGDSEEGILGAVFEETF